jgi:hypothetical protein
MDTNKLITALENITLTKTVNGKTQSNSEVQCGKVKDILETFEFKQLQITGKKLEKWLNDNPEKGLYYVYQPYGSQKSPDFMLINVADKITTQYLECKSGCGKILWNDGYPTEDTIYIFTCTKSNTTTFFTSDIMSPKMLKIFKSICLQIKAINTETKKTADDGWCFYIRKATSQKFPKLSKEQISTYKKIVEKLLKKLLN